MKIGKRNVSKRTVLFLLIVIVIGSAILFLGSILHAESTVCVVPDKIVIADKATNKKPSESPRTLPGERDRFCVLRKNWTGFMK